MSIDLFQLYALIVIFTLFAFGMLFIVIGLKAEGAGNDSANRLSCGHPLNAVRYVDGDRGGMGYCIECIKEAERANRD